MKVAILGSGGVGPTPLWNLYLNSGQGTPGWTMACNSAAVLSERIGDRTPEIETADLAIGRHR